MAITNYGELKTAVADWAERSDLTARIEDFIRYAHDEIVRELVLNTDLTLSSGTVALPTDCREIVSLWALERQNAPLDLASAYQMTQVSATGSGDYPPSLYRQSGTDVLLAPAPTSTYAGRLLYRLSRTFFTADADTNTALTRYPNLYLHGALAELMRYLRDSDGEATYEGRFRGQLVDAIKAETAQVTQGAMLQTRSGFAV